MLLLPALSVPVKVGIVLVSPEPVTVPVTVITRGEPEFVVDRLVTIFWGADVVKLEHPVPEPSLHVI